MKKAGSGPDRQVCDTRYGGGAVGGRGCEVDEVEVLVQVLGLTWRFGGLFSGECDTCTHRYNATGAEQGLSRARAGPVIVTAIGNIPSSSSHSREPSMQQRHYLLSSGSAELDEHSTWSKIAMIPFLIARRGIASSRGCSRQSRHRRSRRDSSPKAAEATRSQLNPPRAQLPHPASRVWLFLGYLASACSRGPCACKKCRWQRVPRYRSRSETPQARRATANS